MKKLFLILCLLPCLLAAQPAEKKWEYTFGGHADDVFYRVIEASNGYLLAVGATHSRTSGGTDGYLVILDHSTGGKVAEQRFGGSRDDVLTDIVQTFDGHFLLAGYTESSGYGKRDAWLIKIDEEGRPIWKQTFGTGGRDAFKRIALLPDGSLMAAGYKEDSRTGDIWIANLREQEIVWEKTLGRGSFDEVRGMALLSDGGLALVGNTQSAAPGGKGNAYLLRTTPTGDLQWDKYFGERDWEEAFDVIVTQDGNLAFCGLTTSREGAGDMDMWLVKVNPAGFRQWEKLYGGKDADLAHSLAESPDGQLLLGGGTKSHRSGARQYSAWLVRTDAGGVTQWEYPYGDNKDDIAHDITFLHDGSMVMAGNSASHNGAWLVRWTGRSNLLGAGLAGAKQSGIEYSQARLHTADGKLKPNDRSYLSFTLTNRSGADLNGLQIGIDRRQTVNGLDFWQTNYLKSLPDGQQREIRIPVRADALLESGESTLGVNIMAGTTQLAQFTASVTSKKPIDASVEFSDYQFAESRTSDEQILDVIIRNPGDFATRAVSVIFTLPEGLVAVSPNIVNLPSIPPHGSRRVQLKFKKMATFRSSNMNIVCTVRTDGKQYQKTLERALSTGNEVLMILTQPNETKTDITNIVSENNIYSIQLGVNTPSPVQQRHFTVYRNNQALDGSKMDEVDLTDQPAEGGRYKYVYEANVRLEPGENKVQIRIQMPTGEVKSSTMVIYYEPRQPNLHVLAIGPRHQDLRFTSKDATDFANAFTGQQGSNKLFGQVFIRQLVSEEETEADRIREAVADLVYQANNPAAARRILRNDVLLVFISSHGKNSQDGFLLLPSNYDPRYERTRTIDFQRDVVRELEKIDCKKVVFIDACHSGAADSKELTDIARADALTKLAAMHPGMSTLTSCRSNELSYEDPRWQNGAFTEAILEAFDNVSCRDENGIYHADIDNNSVITLGELYDFLLRRVPHLVRSQKPNASTNQTPFMPENQLQRENMSLFVIDKK